MDHFWQEINVGWLSCHSWQESNESMITAMTTLTLVLALIAVLAAFAGLVSYARHDHFAGGRNRTPRRDDLGCAERAGLSY